MGTDLEGLALSGAAGKSHAVHRTGVVKVHGVAFHDGAILNLNLGGLLVALFLNLGVNLSVGDLSHFLLHSDALVLAEGNLRHNEHLSGELQVLAGADLLDLDLRTIHDVHLVLLNGRAVHFIEDQLESLVVEDALAVHILDHLARRLALAEARDIHLAANLDVSLAHRLVELGGVDVKGQLNLIAGNLFNSNAHALVPPCRGCVPVCPKTLSYIIAWLYSNFNPKFPCNP